MINYEVGTIKEKITNSLLNNQHLLLKSFTSSLPTWEDFLNHLDAANKKESGIIQDYSDLNKSYGKIQINKDKSIQFGNSLHFKITEYCLPIFNDIFNSYGKGGGVFMDLVSRLDSNYELHYDGTDVFHFQCLGTSEWQLSKTKEDFDSGIQDTLVMNPGDLMFIPKGTWHKVRSLSPRVGMTMNYNYEARPADSTIGEVRTHGEIDRRFINI